MIVEDYRVFFGSRIINVLFLGKKELANVCYKFISMVFSIHPKDFSQASKSRLCNLSVRSPGGGSVP